MNTTNEQQIIRDYMRQNGRKGGAAGRGLAKTRSPEHYRKAGLAGNAAQKAKREKKP